MSDVLDLSGFDELRALIEQMPDIALEAAGVAMDRALLFLLSVIPAYPPPPTAPAGSSAKFWTDKQRRFFFWAMRRGKIKVPYVRTGFLGQSFTSETRRLGDSVDGEFGTSAANAPWVVGPDYPGQDFHGHSMYQARIHEGRWFQFEDVFDAHKDEAMDLFEAEFRAEFIRRLEQVG